MSMQNLEDTLVCSFFMGTNNLHSNNVLTSRVVTEPTFILSNSLRQNTLLWVQKFSCVYVEEVPNI